MPRVRDSLDDRTAERLRMRTTQQMTGDPQGQQATTLIDLGVDRLVARPSAHAGPHRLRRRGLLRRLGLEDPERIHDLRRREQLWIRQTPPS